MDLERRKLFKLGAGAAAATAAGALEAKAFPMKPVLKESVQAEVPEMEEVNEWVRMDSKAVDFFEKHAKFFSFNGNTGELEAKDKLTGKSLQKVFDPKTTERLEITLLTSNSGIACSYWTTDGLAGVAVLGRDIETAEMFLDDPEPQVPQEQGPDQR